VVKERRDGKAAKRFYRRLLHYHVGKPRKIVTDKLRSYGVTHRELIFETIHDTSQYANNKAEPRVREWGMRRFKSPRPSQHFVSIHAAVYNLPVSGGILLRLSTSETLGKCVFMLERSSGLTSEDGIWLSLKR